MSQPILITPAKIVQLFEATLAAEGINPELRQRIRTRFLYGDPAGPVTRFLYGDPAEPVNRPIVLCPECRAESVDIEQLGGADRSCDPGTIEIRYQPCGHRRCIPAAANVVMVAPPHPTERFDPRRHVATITGLDGSR